MGSFASALAWGDYDSDGDLDLVTSGFDLVSGRVTRLYDNDGTGLLTVNDQSLTGGAATDIVVVVRSIHVDGPDLQPSHRNNLRWKRRLCGCRVRRTRKRGFRQDLDFIDPACP